MHVVGVIAWGYCEVYYIMNSDQAKDSNMECTCISKVLDKIHEILDAEGIPGTQAPT